MTRLSELQQDILKIADRHPDMTDEAVAGIVGCNEDWVAKTRRKHESEMSEADLPDEWQTIEDPFGGPLSSESSEPSESSSSSGSSSLLGAMLIWPVKLAVWVVAVSLKVMLWCVALPFRLLGAGGSNSGN